MRPTLDTFKKKVLQDKQAKALYDSLEPEFALIRQFVKARKKACLSQVELAKRLDVHQPAVTRLERGG